MYTLTVQNIVISTEIHVYIVPCLDHGLLQWMLVAYQRLAESIQGSSADRMTPVLCTSALQYCTAQDMAP
jgi:hypothetical protein